MGTRRIGLEAVSLTPVFVPLADSSVPRSTTRCAPYLSSPHNDLDDPVRLTMSTSVERASSRCQSYGLS